MKKQPRTRVTIKRNKPRTTKRNGTHKNKTNKFQRVRTRRHSGGAFSNFIGASNNLKVVKNKRKDGFDIQHDDETNEWRFGGGKTYAQLVKEPAYESVMHQLPRSGVEFTFDEKTGITMSNDAFVKLFINSPLSKTYPNLVTKASSESKSKRDQPTISNEQSMPFDSDAPQDDAALQAQKKLQDAAQKKLQDDAAALAALQAKQKQDAALQAKQKQDAALQAKQKQDAGLKALQQQQELQKQQQQAMQQKQQALAPQVIDTNEKYNEAILKMIGFGMFHAKTYLIGCSFDQPQKQLDFEYYAPSDAVGSKTATRSIKIDELFRSLGYEPLPDVAPHGYASFNKSSFVRQVRVKIREISTKVGFKLQTNTTTTDGTTIAERYNHDFKSFLKYLQKTKKTIVDLNDKSAVAHWIAMDIWNNYTTEEQIATDGVKTVTTKGGFFGIGAKVTVTYEPPPAWLRHVMKCYEYLAPIFKCVFEAQLIEHTQSKPVAAAPPKAPATTAPPPVKTTPPPKAPLATTPATKAPYMKDSDLINSNATMCYLDAAMQMLRAIPEIPEYFRDTTDAQINALQEITDPTEKIMKGCGSQKDETKDAAIRAKEKSNILLLKIIFDKIYANNLTQTKTTIIIIKDAADRKRNAYAKLVQGQPMPNNPFLKIRDDGNMGYDQADPSEFMTLLFFANFSCFQVPFMNQIGVIESVNKVCQSKKNITDSQIQSQVITLALNEVRSTSIQTLLDQYTTVEKFISLIDACGAKANPDQDELLMEAKIKGELSAIQTNKPLGNPSQQIRDARKAYENASIELLTDAANQVFLQAKEIAFNAMGSDNWAQYFKSMVDKQMELYDYKLQKGLIGRIVSKQNSLRPIGKYVLFSINRKLDPDPANLNESLVEISRGIVITGINFRRKGCIFHSGSGGGGHYVYGAYDAQGNPEYVINDIESYSSPPEQVFSQNGWLSTMVLYERV